MLGNRGIDRHVSDRIPHELLVIIAERRESILLCRLAIIVQVAGNSDEFIEAT